VLSAEQHTWLLKNEAGLLALAPRQMYAELARAFGSPDRLPEDPTDEVYVLAPRPIGPSDA
jgi:hypothetical protein